MVKGKNTQGMSWECEQTAAAGGVQSLQSHGVTVPADLTLAVL